MTDQPNVEVCWQVCGNRKDAFAKAQSLEVEIQKSAEERGKYQNPEIFGFGLEQAVRHFLDPRR